MDDPTKFNKPKVLFYVAAYEAHCALTMYADGICILHLDSGDEQWLWFDKDGKLYIYSTRKGAHFTSQKQSCCLSGHFQQAYQEYIIEHVLLA